MMILIGQKVIDQNSNIMHLVKINYENTTTEHLNSIFFK